MIRTLYHGSPKIVRTPAFRTGSSGNDFGIGFYCTDSFDIASEWAAGRTSSGAGPTDQVTGLSADGFVNIYKLNDSGLRILDLGSPQYCILHWLGVLLSYREFDTLTPRAYQARDYLRTAFGVDHQNYDCIVGWRADNVHFAFAQFFLNGMISYEQLRDAVRLSGLGRQIVIKSNRAFDRLLFNGYEIVRRRDLYPVRVAREQRALAGMADIVRSPGEDILHNAPYRADDAGNSKRGGLYIFQMMEENVRDYDPRLI